MDQHDYYEDNSSSNKTKSGGKSSGGNSSRKKQRASQANKTSLDYDGRPSQGDGLEEGGGGFGGGIGGRRVSMARGQMTFGKEEDGASSGNKTKSSKSSGGVRDKKSLGKKLSRKEAVSTLGELDERKGWENSAGGDYYLEELTPSKAKTQLVIENPDDDEAFSIFRIENPAIGSSPPKIKEDDKQSDKSSKGSKAPPPSSVEEEFYESESLELNDDHAEELTSFEDEGYSYNDRVDYGDTSEEGDAGEEGEGGRMTVGHKKSRGTMMREKWEEISEMIMRSWNSPCRVFKLRGYHSEPDLTIPFEDKFDPKLEAFEGQGKDGLGRWKKFQEKYVSCEDLILLSGWGKEHPDLVRGVLSEVKLRSYAIDENMKNSWWELYDWERKRFSFFDELFAMGYVVDSLEVLSPPPRGDDGVATTTGEYFVEAEERHFRKKVDYGRVVFKTKHVYTGNFQDWYFEGPGRYCWQDGTVYQGEFSGGLMNGPGSIHWPDGCIYEGHFIYGKRSGWGVYSSADGQNTYAGDWLNGLPHGHGKMWYDPEDDDNDYYEGQWERGLPQGVGTRQYSTGDRYVGNWVEGMRNGYGIMIWLQERQVFKGEWLDGVPHGFGKHIWYLERTPTNNFPARHVYQGSWVEGKREGIGKMVYPCGSVYEGRWKNGQRHGKGMFINPAGDILVGLFRAGSILGGSDVPLHAPTYECDFAGLTEWMVARFKLRLVGGGKEGEENKEEEQLLEITKRYLPYIRKLYHRAGEYSHKYGKHGLYPAYMKKSSENIKAGSKLTKDCVPPPTTSSEVAGQGQEKDKVLHDTSYHVGHHREYTRLDEPEHMKGKLEKPESLDGVNPVTRFGLWLLLRDCDSVMDEVTMAYYDKLWCETPPLSFQTRHNPFEPVYLWQFLQALIVASVAYFVDIPRIRQHDHQQDKKSDGGMEPEAVSDTTLRGGMGSAEQRRVEITRLRRHNAQQQVQMQSSKNLDVEDDAKTVGGKKSKHHKGGKSVHNGGKGNDDDAKTTKTGKKEKNNKGKGGDGGGGAEGGVPQQSKISTMPVEEQGKSSSSQEDGAGGKDKKGAAHRRTSKNSKNSNKSSGKSTRGKNKKKSKESKHVEEILVEPVEEDEEEDEEVEEYLEEGREEDEEEEGDEEEMEEGEEEEDGDDDSPSMGRKSVLFRREAGEDYTEQSSPFLSGYSISECFESFLYKKLIPCLRRDAGCNLPVMPQPLPALVDMYDAFKAIKERDIIRGKEFLRAALPHLMFPPRKEALWWHRCPEPLSHDIDLEGLMETMHQKFDAEEVEDYGMVSGGGGGTGKGEDFEQKFESEYLGAQAQNSETTLRLLRLCREDPLHPECHALGALKGEGVGHTPTLPIVDSSEILKDLQGTESEEDVMPMSEYITEGNPFAEDDLVPEPFLWADDYKCIPIRKRYQHFENINTQDVFNVMHQLYPKMCRGKHENNLQFELIFCDWLWCVSILAKTSTEREVRDAWKTKSKDEQPRPLTNPQSLGVYAHYIRQIKNNPYLSPTPPPDFKPKIKPKHDDEKKAVKFQSITSGSLTKTKPSLPNH